MEAGLRKCALSTSGGEVPGLNAGIRGATETTRRLGRAVVGLRNGFDGLLKGDGLVSLTVDRVQGIERLGGAILIASEVVRHGVRRVGMPRTINVTVGSTCRTFGFIPGNKGGGPAVPAPGSA